MASANLRPPRPFRFGVLAADADSARAWQDKARRVETLGYSTLLVDDHLYRSLAPIAALMSAADATTTLRIGSGVFANDFRHPLLLAREAATLDVLSGGRFELGIGTGYSRGDYEQSGIPFDPPATRVGRIAEAVCVIQGTLRAEPFTFSGKYYQVCAPETAIQPVQHPHLPLLIGGGGRRMLSIAARHADIVGINVRTTAEGSFDFASITRDATIQKVEWARQAAGERAYALEFNILAPFVEITDAREESATRFLHDWGMTEYLSPQEFLASPHVLIGSEELVVEMLLERRETMGISYIIVFDDICEAFASIVARLSGR